MSLPPVWYGLLDEPVNSSRTLSQVCFRWRDTALSVSRLWNHITLSRWSQNRIEWIEELSRRSHRTPVSLRVWIGGRGWHTEDSVFFDARLSRLLKDLMPRTKTLEVRLDCTLLASQRAPNIMRALRNHAVPLLESFHLTPFNNQRTTDYSPLDFFFDGKAPKLTSLRFNIHFSALHSSILLNITTFCLADGSTFTDPNFTWMQCLNLLKAMPSLENLLLTIEFTPDTMDNDADIEEISLPNLKHFHMEGTCHDCGCLLEWIRFPPGCTFNITSNDTEMNSWCSDLLQALEYCVSESEISATGNVLDIQVCHGFLCLVLHPLSEKKPVYFRFNSLINTIYEEDDEGEDNAADPPSNATSNSLLYAHLFLFARMIHRMDLFSQAAELHLGVDVMLPMEIYTAPVFGSLVRACKQAKRVVLTGSENHFILPVILDFMQDRTLDAFILGRESSSSSDSDADFSSDSEDYIFSKNKKLTTPNLPPTVNFLHTDFDITTFTNKCHLMDLIIWYQTMLPLVRDTFWPVPMLSVSMPVHALEVSKEGLTTRDVMDYYLQPAVGCTA